MRGIMDLYLNSYGTYLHVRDGMFEIKVPAQADGTPALSREVAAKKVRTIVLGTPGVLSTDAIRLALQHNIDILFSEGDRVPFGRIWHPKLGSTTSIRKRQLEASLSKVGLGYVIRWLCEKLDRQARIVDGLGKHRLEQRDWLTAQAATIRVYAGKIEACIGAVDVDTVAESLRGYEGTGGRIYFETLSTLMPRRYKFAGRSVRPAADPFNAFLNYGYAILYGRIEKALMIAGIEPYLGFMHRDGYQQKSMVFDFIEPYRPWVDHVVFRLFTGKRVNDESYRQITQGVTLVKPGKALLVDALYKFIDEDRIRYRGRNETRQNALQRDAHRFANELIGK